MSFRNVTVTPTSAVATSGTITAAYPDGTSAGSFAGYGHRATIKGHQTFASTDAGDFTLTFGASDITFTWNGSTSIPANTEVTIQLNERGQDDGEPEKLPGSKRIAKAPVFRIDLGSPDQADSDGIAASQSVSSAFTLNGAYASGGVATLDVPRNVVAAWTTTAVLTITGEDEFGNDLVEVSASGTSHTGKKAFKKITSVTASTAITGATVGTGTVLGLPVFVEAAHQILAQYEDNALVGEGGGLVYLNATTAALSSASQVYMVSPVAGTIVDIYAVTNVAVTTADSTLTVKTAGGTVGTITIATSGSAVGVVDSIGAIANASVLAGGTIEVENDAAPGAGQADITVLLKTEAFQGTFVAGVQTAATGTTGDVRGTFDPATAPDGSTEYSFLVSLPDPNYRGVNQYAG